MKKIPTLFKREFENGKVVSVTDEVTEGCEEIFNGKGQATVKIDGSCAAIIDGEFYKRYDAKKGKPIPQGAIPCQEKPDPTTGHFPCWVLVDPKLPENKWFMSAYERYVEIGGFPKDGTYECVGVHFNGNKHNMTYDMMYRHGDYKIGELDGITRTKEVLKDWLEKNDYAEGIVFWLNGEPKCKIKKTDFGIKW